MSTKPLYVTERTFDWKLPSTQRKVIFDWNPNYVRPKALSFESYLRSKFLTFEIYIPPKSFRSKVIFVWKPLHSKFMFDRKPLSSKDTFDWKPLHSTDRKFDQKLRSTFRSTNKALKFDQKTTENRKQKTKDKRRKVIKREPYFRSKKVPQSSHPKPKKNKKKWQVLRSTM